MILVRSSRKFPTKSEKTCKTHHHYSLHCFWSLAEYSTPLITSPTTDLAISCMLTHMMRGASCKLSIFSSILFGCADKVQGTKLCTVLSSNHGLRVPMHVHAQSNRTSQSQLLHRVVYDIHVAYKHVNAAYIHTHYMPYLHLHLMKNKVLTSIAHLVLNSQTNALSDACNACKRNTHV
jgi:hypothetical protein